MASEHRSDDSTVRRPAVGIDLRAWIDQLRELDEIVELKGVDAELEIGALTDLNAKHRGPALLFSDIKGHEGRGRVVTCTLSRAARLATALGLDPSLDNAGVVDALRGLPRRWDDAIRDHPTATVDDGPVMEEVAEGEALDMRSYPAPLWHEGDGGRYLGTGGSVITRDPEDGSINAGTYRVSVHGQHRLGLFIEPINHGAIHLRKYHERGEPAPVVASFGHGPLVYLASSMPVPYGVDELDYVGAMAGEPLRVIEGPVTGLPIPADAELAIEGWVHPGAEELEGPFGEFTGYFAGGRTMRPVIEVARAYQRPDPIIYGSLPAKPPFDHSYWRAALESSMLVDELTAAGIPEVKAAWKHEAGSANFFNVVAIRQRYAGHAIQVGTAAALVAGGVSMGRYVVVVDDDIDVMDLEEVVWAISSRTDPARSIQILRDTPTNPLDPMLEDENGLWVTSRAVINACRPFERLDSFADVVEVSPGLADRMRRDWGAQIGWPA